MPIIDEEILKNPELLKKADLVIEKIKSRLGWESPGGFNGIISAYLLYCVSTYNNPFDVDYDALFSLDLGLSEDTILAVRENITKDKWKKLLELLYDFEPEAFALAAFNSDRWVWDRGNATITTPRSLVKLSEKILDIKPGEKVADLCCGHGTFLVDAIMNYPDAFFYGYEVYANSKLIAEIRTKLVSDYSNEKLFVKDVFALCDNDSISFDKIFCNYPFGLRMKEGRQGSVYMQRFSDNIPSLSRTTSSDWTFNALICKLLEENGKAVGIMTSGSTWNTIDMPARKYFIENGYIECIIAFPPRMFSSIGTSTSMIVMSRGNKSIRMVDATEIFHAGRRYNEFTDEDIDMILQAMSNGEKGRTITIEEFRENEYSLNYGRYFRDQIKVQNGVPFSTVIKDITRGAPCNAKQLDAMSSEEPTGTQYLLLANIKDGVISEDLPYLTNVDKRLEKYLLKDNDLILSKNGYPYKTAVANIKKGQRILANGNLYIIELDQEKVDPYFIKAFLESDVGIATLKSITVGATIPNIGVDNLKRIQIPLLPMEEQKRIAELYKTAMDEVAVYKLKIEKALNRMHHIFDEESEDENA